MSTIIARPILLLTTLIVMSVLSCYSLYTYDNIISAVAQDDNTSISKNGYSDKNNNNDNDPKTSSIENNRTDNASANASSFTSSPPSLYNSGIDVNTFPVGIAVNPNTKKVYVANEYSNTVSVIDTETDKVQNRINVDVFPYGIDTNPLNNRVYVTNKGSNTVSVLDGSIDTKLLDISVGKSPV